MVALSFMKIDHINSLSQLSIWIIIQDYPLSLITQGRWDSEIFEDAVQPTFANILRFTVPHGHPSQSINLSHRTILSPHPLRKSLSIPWVPWRFSHHGQGEKIWKTTRWSKHSPQTTPKGLLPTRGLSAFRSGKEPKRHGKGVFGKLKENKVHTPPPSNYTRSRIGRWNFVVWLGSIFGNCVSFREDIPSHRFAV